MEAAPTKRRRISLEEGKSCTFRVAESFVADHPKFRFLEATPDILSALTAGEKYDNMYFLIDLLFIRV